MEFVEDKGNGNSNPLMAMANSFTKDQSSWKEQFRAQERGGPPRSMTREAEERAMMERYFNDPRGPPPPHFDPSQLPPAAFRQFINSFGPEDFRNMNLSPAQEAQLRERARVLSSHFGEMGDQRYQDFMEGMNFAPLPHDPRNQWIEQFRTETGQQTDPAFNAAWERARSRPPMPLPQQWSEEFRAEEREAEEMKREFLEQQGMQPGAGAEWAQQFEKNEEEEWEQKWNDRMQSNWASQFTDDDENLMKHYQEVWEQAQARTKPQHYIFDPANPYLNDPEAFTKGVQLFDEGHLPEAIKALEAAVQQDTTNVDAWTKLGQAQAENDKDDLAINALSEAIARNPGHLEALLSLAVSHTNEFHLQQTSQTLYQWVSQNPKYSQMVPTNPFVPMDEHGNLRIIEQILIDCAKSQRELDPDLHINLGLVYNLSFEYDKAIECFKAALSARPEDYALWNKLGATVANSSYGKDRTPQAIDAYFRALEQVLICEEKPTYTRARANLGISFMSAQDYVESAKCFLGALSINDSPHLWDSLRTVFSMMDRQDLRAKCHEGNVELFRSEFQF